MNLAKNVRTYERLIQLTNDRGIIYPRQFLGHRHGTITRSTTRL